MHYYEAIPNECGVDDPLVIVRTEPKTLDVWTVMWGAPIHDWPSEVTMFSSGDGTPDDVLQNHLVWPVYSASLRSVLQKATIGGIQYLPVLVKTAAGSQFREFTVANILNRVSAMDRTRSVYKLRRKPRPGQSIYEDVRKVVLEVNRIPSDMHILRLDERPNRVVVSETFRAVFVDSGFTGYDFVKMEESNNA